MNTTDKPTDATTFRTELAALAAQKAHVRVQYYTDIREFITVHATIRELHEKDGQEVLQLSTGEEIPVESLVRVGTVAAPGYDDDYFKCDC